MTPACCSNFTIRSQCRFIAYVGDTVHEVTLHIPLQITNNSAYLQQHMYRLCCELAACRSRRRSPNHRLQCIRCSMPTPHARQLQQCRFTTEQFEHSVVVCLSCAYLLAHATNSIPCLQSQTQLPSPPHCLFAVTKAYYVHNSKGGKCSCTAMTRFHSQRQLYLQLHCFLAVTKAATAEFGSSWALHHQPDRERRPAAPPVASAGSCSRAQPSTHCSRVGSIGSIYATRLLSSDLRSANPLHASVRLWCFGSVRSAADQQRFWTAAESPAGGDPPVTCARRCGGSCRGCGGVTPAVQ